MSKGPDKIYGPQLSAIMLKFCQDIYKESKASGIRISAEFLYRKGKGDLTLKSFITPDGSTERIEDSNVLAPRGTKLSNEAFRKLKVISSRRKK